MANYLSLHVVPYIILQLMIRIVMSSLTPIWELLLVAACDCLFHHLIHMHVFCNESAENRVRALWSNGVMCAIFMTEMCRLVARKICFGALLIALSMKKTNCCCWIGE